MRLFVGDDWAEAHHDVELMDASGRRLAKARLPEGVAGMARLHAMIGERLGESADESEVMVGIETDRGPWVAALVAAGYTVLAVNPLQAARYRERLSVSGAKSDAADAHMLADMVRTDAHQLRPVAGDSPQAEAVKVVARMHKTLIWERTRHAQRLRHALRDYFPAALAAFDDLDAPEALDLLGRAADPAAAAKLTISQISAALKRAGRRGDLAVKAAPIQASLRTEQLGRPAVVSAAYAASVRSLIAVLTTVNEQVTTLHKEVEAHFGQHPAAEIITSQPGLGAILGARVLAEFGDDPHRYVSAKARKNYAGTSPITRASGKKKVVAARFVHNDRLIDALITQAATAVRVSPGARAYYDKQRARDTDYNTALRQVANRLVGILRSCRAGR
ncbi:IS110 family transposase [Nonomuraea aurantiaca]|uniref:IS110 family transposase n=1 Tax=Nonomuraea aurantiaca TaxID=2878562 RepID=UPI001CD99FE7|nr:IS110 family transposase [Nonomuraea aurantiaca]MCA2230323.1 IS110 family transposase [Nonomuraea aurantiaca]